MRGCCHDFTDIEFDCCISNFVILFIDILNHIHFVQLSASVVVNLHTSLMWLKGSIHRNEICQNDSSKFARMHLSRYDTSWCYDRCGDVMIHSVPVLTTKPLTTNRSSTVTWLSFFKAYSDKYIMLRKHASRNIIQATIIRKVSPGSPYKRSV